MPTMLSTARPLALLSLLFAAGVASPALAQVFTETTDAGTLPGAALPITGSGPLTRINGSLGAAAGDQIDLFIINIVSPSTFSAATRNLGQSFMSDTQLFLFSLDGVGIAKNDDIDEINYLSDLPVGDPAYASLTPGLYILGIAPYGVLPTIVTNPTSTTQSVFPFQPFTGVTGPLNGSAPMIGFGTISGFASTGDYAIDLTGTAAVPTPAAASLLALGAAAGLTRRRRTR
jgi:hypothetical protein